MFSVTMLFSCPLVVSRIANREQYESRKYSKERTNNSSSKWGNFAWNPFIDHIFPLTQTISPLYHNMFYSAFSVTIKLWAVLAFVLIPCERVLSGAAVPTRLRSPQTTNFSVFFFNRFFLRQMKYLNKVLFLLNYLCHSCIITVHRSHVYNFLSS